MFNLFGRLTQHRTIKQYSTVLNPAESLWPNYRVVQNISCLVKIWKHLEVKNQMKAFVIFFKCDELNSCLFSAENSRNWLACLLLHKLVKRFKQSL